MMIELPPFLKQGEPARLFPLIADTSREQRIASILLSVLPQIPALASALMGTTGLRVGARTRIESFTEIVLRQDGDKRNRPDGLIVISNGKSSWSALVEAKVGKADLNSEQVQRYLELARDNGINAVITISNEFVARADHSPVQVPKILLRKVNLFHWSWMSIVTECEILAHQRAVVDQEQAFLLRELLRYLNDLRTGVERFTQMGPHWKDLVQSVANHVNLKKSAPEVEEAVGCWFEEERDLGLQLSRHVGQPVEPVIERKLKDDPAARLKVGIGSLVDECMLASTYRVPDSAGDIDVKVDLRSKTIATSMRIKAPLDKKTTRARVNWLVRMIKEDDARLMVRAHWPGRAQPTQQSLQVLRENPDALQTENAAMVPHAFEVILVDGTGNRFGGRRTFIEDVETIVPAFYDLVGQHLRAWQPAPPRPVQKKVEEALGDDASILDQVDAINSSGEHS